MKRLLCILFFCVNSWGLTSGELTKLERYLGNEPLAPWTFVEGCYDLLILEENPRNVEYLYQLFDIAQRRDSEEVLSYLKGIKNFLQIK